MVMQQTRCGKGASVECKWADRNASTDSRSKWNDKKECLSQLAPRLNRLAANARHTPTCLPLTNNNTAPPCSLSLAAPLPARSTRICFA